MAERISLRPGGRRTHRAAARVGARPLALVPALVLLLGAASAGCSGDAGAARAAGPGGPATPAAPVLGPAVPDRIEIPDLKVDAALDTVDLDARGVMREPDFAKPDDAAWYRQGPTPGEQGAAAIVGHMDTPQAPEAVFFNLKELKKDQRIEVHRTDGTTAVFAVDAVDTFKKDAFPTDRVYGDTHGRAELRLITCGGDLTADRHWDANVVVFAHLTGRA
ncbi:class F sortase [Streptomyces sp. NPDC058623]|uniref:class F sortase n=1 Tax=Streptomyces sp. NPDC058623 TaxID=3346563 RepID=UPI003659CB33